MNYLQISFASLLLLAVSFSVADTQLFSNNAKTTLSASLSSGSTTATVGDGSGFQTPGAGEYELATLTDGSNIEIVKITARSGNTLTITRAQEGTSSPATFSAGTIVSGNVTAGSLDNFVQLSSDQSVDLSQGSLQIPASATLPGSCSGSQIYQDTGATSGAQFYACESGSFVLQGGGGGGSSLSYSDQTITTSDLTASPGYSYRLTVSGMTADRNLILPASCSDGDVIAWTLVTDAPTQYELILKGDTGVTVSIPSAETTAAEVTRYFIKNESGRVVCDASAKWIMGKEDDGRIASGGTMTLGGSSITTNNADQLTQIQLTTIEEEVGGWGDTSTAHGFVARRDAAVLAWGNIGTYVTTTTYFSGYIYTNSGPLAITVDQGNSVSIEPSLPIVGKYVKLDFGDTLDLRFWSHAADIGVDGTVWVTNLSFREILN